MRIVVPFGPGSLTDILARIIAEDASKKWNQQVIVENRPGLPGTIAVARAEPDGLTLMLTSNGHAAVGYINKNAGFDPVRDFAGITRLATIPMYLIVHPDVPAKTVAELIALAKSKPGTLNFASPGLGSGGYIAAALFKKLAGIEIVHIPYKGAPEAMTATVRGDAQIYFTPLNLTDELVQTGGFARSCLWRLRACPSCPMCQRSARAGSILIIRRGTDLWRPRGYRVLSSRRSTGDVIDIIRSAKVQEKLKAQYLLGLADTPAQFDAMIQNDTAALADVFKD